MATMIGTTATRVSAEQQPTAMRTVSITFRGGFGFLITDKKSLWAMTPKRPADACGDWMDHPLYIKGNINEATVEAPGKTIARSAKVPDIWAVQLEGACSIKSGGPSSPLVGPQLSDASALEDPYTPVPFTSENGWNDAAWLLPLGPAPADLNARVKDSLLLNGGEVDVLSPPNTSAMAGRWSIPDWDKGKKHKRALTDRIRVSYSANLASLVIATPTGDVPITPKGGTLDLEIAREIDLARFVVTKGFELRHARMIYALSSSKPCGDLKSPKFEIIKSRTGGRSFTPGDFCPFGLFDIVR